MRILAGSVTSLTQRVHTSASHRELCRKSYFMRNLNYFCQIVKFSEDILKHKRTITSGDFQHGTSLMETARQHPHEH